MELNNGIITINRGDTFDIVIPLNIGTAVEPSYYTLTENDKVYLGIMEANQPFECAIVRKVTAIDNYESGEYSVTFSFDSEETEYLLPGTYFYEVKLFIYDENSPQIKTIISKRKFIILD